MSIFSCGGLFRYLVSILKELFYLLMYIKMTKASKILITFAYKEEI